MSPTIAIDPNAVSLPPGWTNQLIVLVFVLIGVAIVIIVAVAWSLKQIFTKEKKF